MPETIDAAAKMQIVGWSKLPGTKQHYTVGVADGDGEGTGLSVGAVG
jgi:hypothetical protein